ncbi:type II secretion system F family protein [Janibacter terrae]|uniref:Type II secretion system F family protein n=2 Tax=Janibacter terrae TaxID=103817 RepID=A0ABZ2FBW6_9MICO
MPAMIALTTLVTALCWGVLVWAALAGPDMTRRRALANLRRGLTPHGTSDDESHERVAAGLPVLARRLTPPGVLRRLDHLHGRAGRPAAWPIERLLVVKTLLPLFGAVLTLLLASEPVLILLGLLVTLVCYFVPELLLYSRGMERRAEITVKLADTLDQMMIAVEAGLGFDSAMARAGKNGKGPLAEELVRTLQDIQLGQSRREAYEALAERTDVPDLRRFVRAIIQADAYGVAIVDVLRTQAAEMRTKRRQRAEEKAMQIPVKVIFPLMLCILPVLFIVLLGPVVLRMGAAFG